MIRYFHKATHDSHIEEQSNCQAGCWVYVEKPSGREIDELVAQFGLERGYLEDALDANEMPRLEREGDISYIFVRFAFQTGDTTDTAPLLFIFTPEVLITVSVVSLPSLDSFTNGRINFITTARAKLMLLVLRQMSEHYDAAISETSKQIKKIRVRLHSHEIGNRDFVAFVTIQDELNEFMASLQPTNATLRRLTQGNYVPLTIEDKNIIEDLLLNNEQSIESCDANMKSINYIRDAYSSISANNLNRSLKILTVATVLITIPLSITAIYSMNVALPGQRNADAFWVIMAIIFVVMVALTIIGRRKHIF